jgi:DNA polymerase-3 subunit alpha
MAALLTTNSDDKTKTALYLAECRRMGVKVLAPSVNTSGVGYTADGDDIRFGMAAIRNVGEPIVENIVLERNDNGMYSSFIDFLSRSSAKTLNKRVIESLIKAGAFDEFGMTRKSLYGAHEKGVSAATAARKHAATGQTSLFDEGFTGVRT